MIRYTEKCTTSDPDPHYLPDGIFAVGNKFSKSVRSCAGVRFISTQTISDNSKIFLPKCFDKLVTNPH
ncbi:hypothetical protein GCM10020370_60620 [Paenibacillus hodogayensis]